MSEQADSPGHSSAQRGAVFTVALIVCLAVATVAAALRTAPAKADRNAVEYGKTEDVEFAKKLWSVLAANRLVGKARINVVPIKGEPPHAVVQEVLSAKVDVTGDVGLAVVKANHREKGATIAGAYAQPHRYLADYAVMFQRKTAYDPKTGGWFWALYTADGRLKEYKGVPIAGRVGRETTAGCIGCHAKKGGRDYRVLTGR